MLSLDTISLTTAADVMEMLRSWLRAERQRVEWTQSELARRSGVPAATISRFERTGLASTESLFKIVFALDRIEVFRDFLMERQRLASFPRSLDASPRTHPVLRVRHRKERS